MLTLVKRSQNHYVQTGFLLLGLATGLPIHLAQCAHRAVFTR